jgi:hypothetical protein
MKLGLTDEQLVERKKGIGGSDAGRISRQLWLEKTGRAEEEDLSNVLAVQMGSFTEPLNAHWYEKVTGRAITNRNRPVVSSLHSFMRANLDGITQTSRGDVAYWDAKHVGRADQAMLLRYTPQMTHCCIILGLDHWVLSVLIGNSKHEVFEQEVDPVFARALIKRERDFWENYVVPDIDPGDRFEEKVVPPPPAPKLREIKLFDLEWVHDASHGSYNGPCPECDEFIRAQPNWAPEFMAEVQTFASTRGAAIKHAITREKIKAIVPEDIGLIEYELFTFKRDRRGITLSLAKGEDENE